MKMQADIDAAGLPVFGIESVDGEPVQFSWQIGQDRLRLLVRGRVPSALGSVIELDTDEPRLVVSEPANADWAGLHARALIAAAVRLWHRTFRDCEG